MLAKAIVQKFIVAVILASVLSSVHASYCRDCEEEIWEEVPCDVVPTTTTTAAPPTTTPPTTLPPITIEPVTTTTTSAPPTVKPPAATTYQKCYCQCKAGCREFCRKVELNPNAQKQITQISRSAQNAPGGGLIEVKHVHQRKFKPLKYNMPYIPAASAPEEPATYAADNSGEEGNCGVPESTPPPYVPIPLPQPTPYQYPEPSPLPPPQAYPQPLPLPLSPMQYNDYPQIPARPAHNADPYLDSTGYSIDELTKMLSIPSYPLPDSLSQYSPSMPQLPSPPELYGPVANSYGSNAWAAMASVGTPSGVKTSVVHYPSKPESPSSDYRNDLHYAAPPSDTESYLSKYIGNTIPSSKGYDSSSSSNKVSSY